MTDTPVIERIRALVAPIASDLDLDLYDVEQRGGTMRVTVDTPPGSDAGVSLDQLALATRLISREMDHQDPIPGKYTLEVTSPGVERTLRTPAHFRREIGKTISVRLANVEAEERRLEGVLIAADETTATLRLMPEGGAGDDVELAEHVIELGSIDRARTVFVWGPQPKKGGTAGGKKKKSNQSKSNQSKSNQSKSNQSKSNQSKSNESKSNQSKKESS